MRVSLIVLAIVLNITFGIGTFGQNTNTTTRQLIELSRKYQRTNSDSAIYYSELVLRHPTSQKDIWALARANAILGRTKEIKGNSIEGLLHYFESLDLLNQSDTSDYYTSYTLSRNIAAIHSDYQLYDISLKFYDSAEHYLKLHLKYHSEIAKKYNDHVKSYELDYFKYLNQFRLGLSEDATQGFLSLVENNDVPIKIQRSSHNKLANILSDFGDKAGAINNHQAIIDHSSEDSVSIGRALHNIGAEYLKYDELDKAKKYYLESIKVKQILKNSESLFITYLDLGETLLKLKQPKEAYRYLQLALSLEVNISEHPDRFLIYHFIGLSLLDCCLDEAKAYFKKFQALSTEFRNEGLKLEKESKRRELTSRIAQYYLEKESKLTLVAQNQFHIQKMIIMSLSIIAVALTFFWIKKKSDHKKEKAKRERFYQDLLNAGQPNH